MKLKSFIQTLVIALAVALSSTVPAKAEAIPGVAEQPQSYFYTGKPYDQDANCYQYAFRTYSPLRSRWTTSDMSGYPDGSNNTLYCSNSPFSNWDTEGLAIGTYSSTYGTATHWTETLEPTFAFPIQIGTEWQITSPKVISYGGEHIGDVQLPDGAYWVTGEILDSTTDVTNYSNYNPLPVPVLYSTRIATQLVINFWHARYFYE